MGPLDRVTQSGIERLSRAQYLKLPQLCGQQMSNHNRELAPHLGRSFFWPDRTPEFPNDAVLAIAYAISDGVITFVGPCFWMSLILLFLVAELGG
jgi:hypothetical protein